METLDRGESNDQNVRSCSRSSVSTSSSLGGGGGGLSGSGGCAGGIGGGGGGGANSAIISESLHNNILNHNHQLNLHNNIMATADVFFGEVGSTSRVARYYTSGSMHSYSQSKFT
jgi:hypothetical protein